MFSGPFAIPQTLAQRPFMVAFWVLLAPTLVTYVLVSISGIIAPGWTQALYADGTFGLGAWMFFIVAMLIVFMGMSLWSERVGAGAFAGPMRASPDWLAIGVLTGPIVLYMANGLAMAAFAEDYPHWPYHSAEDATALGEAYLRPVVIAFVVVLAPIVEEIAYRGLGMGCLMARGWSPLAATLLTAAIFTATHTQYVLPALIPIFLVGLYFGALRVLSGSMAAPIAAHISTNGTLTLAYWFSTQL